MEQQSAELPLNDRLFVWLDANRKNLITGVLVAVVATCFGFFYVNNKQQKRIKAGEALTAAVVAEYAPTGRTPSPERLLKVASEQSGTSAGAQALLLAAGELFTQARYADAQSKFEQFGRDYPGHAFMTQGLLGVAACFHAQGKLDEAALAYKNILDRHPNASTTTQARFAMASIYETQGKFDQAMDNYIKVVQELRGDQGSALATEAAARANELRIKLPSPQEATASAPTPMPAPGPIKLLTTPATTNSSNP